jgi:hypothetical protein
MSLYLATFSRWPSVNIGISLVTGPDLNNQKERRFIPVDATNIGLVNVNIVSFGWEIRSAIFRKRFNQTRFDNVLSSVLPIMLKPAEAATFHILINEDGIRWASEILKNLGKYPRLSVWTLRVSLVASVGKRFKQRLPPEIRQLILQAESQTRPNHPGDA